MDLDAFLGIDENDPRDRLADYIASYDEALMNDLRERRRALGMSQQDVADRMGIDKSYVSRIERGDRDLLQSTMRRYVMALDSVVVHEVLAFEDVDNAHKARRYFRECSYETAATSATPYRPALRADARERVLTSATAAHV